MTETNTGSSPKKAKKMTKNVKVGLFCIAAVIVFYFGANFLKGIDIFGKKSYYYAVFEDVGPLSPSSMVTLNGYKIGKITGINLMSDNPVKICVEIFVNENVKIPKDSYFEVIKKDILSSAVMDVKMGTSSTFANNRDTLPAVIATDKLASIFENIDGTMSSVKTIATELSTNLVDNGGIAKLNNSLAKLETAIVEVNDIVADKGPEIKRIISDIAVFSTSLKKAAPELEHLVANFNELGDTAKIKIATVLNQAETTMNGVNAFMTMLNNNDGNVGKLLNDNTLYNNLATTTDNLNKLLVDLKENPGRYIHISVFGNKEKKNKNN